jgi:outer membrane protein OmpA-like peptidoglycan-associated protein
MMKRASAMLAASAMAAIFLLVNFVISTNAQTVNSESIIESLKPKEQPKTRSFSSSDEAETEDEKFLRALPTRGIRIEQRNKLDEIVAKNDLPRIEIEINFDYDSDRINTISIADIDELGKALTSETLENSRIVLNGHTDAAGSDEYNQDLSDRRAASVRDYLIANHDILPDRLIAIGYGEEKLKNPADPLAAENRRVEIINLTSQ